MWYERVSRWYKNGWYEKTLARKDRYSFCDSVSKFAALGRFAVKGVHPPHPKRWYAAFYSLLKFVYFTGQLHHMWCHPPKKNGIKCILCTPRPISRSTYRPIVDRCIGRYIDRHSTNMSVDISTATRPIYRPRYVSRHIGRYIGRSIGCVSVDILSDYRPI